MRDILMRLLFGLIPPELPMSGNGPPSPDEIVSYRKAKRRWNQAVAVGLWLALVATLTLSLWAAGRFPFGTPAYAEDLEQFKTAQAQAQQITNQALQELLLGNLVARLMENRRQQCDAIRADDAARKKTYADIMQDLKASYRKTQGELWDEPSCDAL